MLFYILDYAQVKREQEREKRKLQAKRRKLLGEINFNKIRVPPVDITLSGECIAETSSSSVDLSIDNDISIPDLITPPGM